MLTESSRYNLGVAFSRSYRGHINWWILACVQTSPISFHPRKRDVCETASLIVFQYPAVFQEFVESAFIGCLTIATVRNNSDWLSSGNARDNVCDYI